MLDENKNQDVVCRFFWCNKSVWPILVSKKARLKEDAEDVAGDPNDGGEEKYFKEKAKHDGGEEKYF